MKTAKLLILSIIIISFIACNNKENVVKKEVVNTEKATSNEEVIIKLDNPALFEGSTFGEFFQVLYKTGQYEEMVRFSSSDMIKEFGREKLINYYSKIDFGYNIKLKSRNLSGRDIILNYETDIVATKQIMRMPVKIENDTVKINLDKLENNKYFLIN
jgi:hypothetical protein